jgi:peptide/nickel transport system substrate-binding protein
MRRMQLGVLLAIAALCSCTSGSGSAPAHKDNVLRMVPQSDLTILDPIWTTAYVTANHGYMIYDTLFGIDANGVAQPQMVDRYDVSPDRKTWTFTLRDGLQFHDGKPVTSEDVIASLQRWGQRDNLGQVLMVAVDQLTPVDSKTFRIQLNEPYGLVLDSLAGHGGNVPFIMPKQVAATPADQQIADYTGSGPFIFKKEEWKPGEKVVYIKNPNYQARQDPASGTAGGKVVKVDRVEWVIIRDPQTQANALTAGEVDMVEAPPFEQYRDLKDNPEIQMIIGDRFGFQFYLRFNQLERPFNNPKVRQAAMAAMNQSMFLQIQVGVPELYRVCYSVYPCNSSYSTTKGMEFIAKPDPQRARQLLKDSGYDGAPVVLLQPTDLSAISKLPIVAAQLLRDAGFKVDLQSMDWQTLVTRRTKKEGWSIFITSSRALDLANPVSSLPIGGGCEKAWFGWPCDKELERLRRAFADAADESARKTLAEQAQVRAMEIGTHVPIGEFDSPIAARKSIKGMVGFGSGALAMWNLEKE